jgi:hypothetical protein
VRVVSAAALGYADLVYKKMGVDVLALYVGIHLTPFLIL